jgi:hypothetical protein
VFYRAVTERLLTYALGRGLEPFDAVTVDRVAEAVEADGGRFETMLLGIIESPPFQLRRGDDGNSKDSPRLAIPPTPPPEKRRPPKRMRDRPFEADAAVKAADQPAAKPEPETAKPKTD